MKINILIDRAERDGWRIDDSDRPVIKFSGFGRTVKFNSDYGKVLTYMSCGEAHALGLTGENFTISFMSESELYGHLRKLMGRTS